MTTGQSQEMESVPLDAFSALYMQIVALAAAFFKSVGIPQEPFDRGMWFYLVCKSLNTEGWERLAHMFKIEGSIDDPAVRERVTAAFMADTNAIRILGPPHIDQLDTREFLEAFVALWKRTETAAMEEGGTADAGP